MEQDARGDPPRKRVRREYIDLQRRLQQLCLDVAADRKTVPEFLRGIAYNIRWRPVNRENEDGGD